MRRLLRLCVCVCLRDARPYGAVQVAGDAILNPELGLEFKLGVDFKESVDMAVFVSRVRGDHLFEPCPITKRELRQY